MSPGSLPRPCRPSHGVASEITTTPTASTSSHFSMASLARVAAPLERDAHLADIADVPQLGHRQAHPGRLELRGHDAADVLGERLEQLEAPLGQLGHDA